MQRILDLGCGVNKQPGAFGVDNSQNSDADARFDLDAFPWRLPVDHFLVVYMRQSLEHLAHPIKVMQELYRICQHGAMIFIQVPDGCCPGYVQDPSHKSPWNLGSFLYFVEDKQWPPSWEKRQNDYGTRFRILYYHVTPSAAGRTPWGKELYGDNLTVVMQAIKQPAEDSSQELDKDVPKAE